MKKLSICLLSLTAAACLTVGAAADVVWSPVELLPGGWGTVIAVIAVVLVTMFLIRRSGRKK